MAGMKICPNCGTEVPADNKFCGNCGGKIDGDVTTIARISQERAQRRGHKFGHLWRKVASLVLYEPDHVCRAE